MASLWFAEKGGGKDKGTLVRTRLFLFAAALVDGLGLLELPMGLVSPLLLPAAIIPLVVAGMMTAILDRDVASSGLAEVDAARTAAALSSTEGTLSSSCSVVFDRGIRWGFGGCWWWFGGEGLGRGSMSRSKMADEEECLCWRKSWMGRS